MVPANIQTLNQVQGDGALEITLLYGFALLFATAMTVNLNATLFL